MTDIKFTSLLNDLPETVPFVGPETQERQRGAEFAARLGANENTFGASPKAIAAMQDVTGEIWKYGDPTSFDLRNALGKNLGLSVDNIVIGEGIDGLLGYLARMVVGQGDPVVTSDGAYPTFNYHIVGYGGVLHKVPYRDDHEDLDGLLACVNETRARLVYLANPDNPMGTVHKADAIEAFISRLPKTCLLALDEAYIEFAPEGIAPNSQRLFDNVLRFRTFSKGYGMAGARVGYAFGPVPLISQFEKIRNHFGMNRIAQIGAIVALSDQDWVAHLRDQVSEARLRIRDIAVQNRLCVIPSATNFVAIDCGQDGHFAKVVLEHLVQEGIFVRMPFVAPQDRCIRVSAGTKADLDLLAEMLPKALDAARLKT